MGISLFGLTPAATYPALIKFGDNSAISGTLRALSDGLGTDLPIQVSTAGVNFTGTASIGGTALSPSSGVAGAIQFSNGSAFASDAANLFWDDTRKTLGVGTNNPYEATLHVKGVGSNAASTAVFVENNTGLPALIVKNNGTVNLPGNLFAEQGSTMGNGYVSLPARLGVKGSGTTAATNSLLVQNSAGTELFKVQDDGGVQLATLTATNSTFFGLTLAGNSFYSQNDGGTTIGQRAVPAASAILDIRSGNRGFLPPRMTTTQRDAIVSPATGLKIYNTTLGTTDTYDGATWQRFGQQTLIKGSGSTSATTSLLVQNSAGSTNLRVSDNGNVSMGDPTASGGVGTFEFYQFWRFLSSGASIVGCYKSQQGFSVDGSRMCVNVASGSHANSASFQVDSTTTGILPPRMTTTQKNAIASPAAGLTVYDSTTNKLNYNNGTTWKEITPDGYTGLVTINALPPVTFDIQNGIIVNVI
jgi:hypothetical protein